MKPGAQRATHRLIVAAVMLRALEVAAQTQPSGAPAVPDDPARSSAQSGAGRAVTDAGTQAPRKLEPVEVTGTGDGRLESTATRIIVTHDDIVRFGDTTLADVLKRLPGITVGGVQGRGGEIRMRGLGSGYTQILLNGEPTAPGFSLDSLAPDLIERIEILRAPTADITAQAIAGTINIILRKDVRKARRELKLAAETERGHPSVSANGQVSDRAGAWSYVVVGTLARERRDYPSVAEQFATDAAANPTQSWVTRQSSAPEISTVNLAPRVTWTAGDSDTLIADTLIRFRRITDDGRERTQTLFGPPRTYASDELPYQADTTTVRSTLNWVHQASGGATLEGKFGINYNHRQSRARFLGFDDHDTFIFDRTVLGSATDEGFSISGKYLTPFANGHALAIGWQNEYSERDERRTQRDLTPPGVPVYSADENFDARVVRLAVFAQDEWDITPRWSAYIGARWEGLDTRTTGNVIREVHNRSDVVSPIFQTLWKLPGRNDDQVRASLSRTYKPPTTFELTPRRYIANDNTPTTPDFQGNPDLRPELAWGVDAAYEHTLPDGGLLGASAYVRRIDDVILQRLANVNGTWIASLANNGGARVRGLEFEARFNVRSWRKAAPNITVRANLARNWSSVDRVPGPDNRLDRQTPTSANVGFDYIAEGAPLSVGANFGFQGGGPVRVSPTQSALVSAKRVLDAYALWKLDANTQLRVSLANVLAQDHVTVAEYFDENGTLQLTTTSPTRLTIRAVLELAF